MVAQSLVETQTSTAIESKRLKAQTLLAAVDPLVVFNFHHVEPVVTKQSRRHISITTEGLKRFISIIRDAGFEPISLKALFHNPSAFRPQPDKQYCLLTLDDGLKNNYSFAWPVFQEAHCPFTIFVLPGKFGGTNDWDEGHLAVDQRDALMTVEDMQEMALSPYVTFGSHGLHHVHFPQLSQADLLTEILESHELLSTLLPQAYVPVLAYPWGEHSEAVCQTVEAASPYVMAFGTQTGICRSAASSFFTLPRYSVYYRDGHSLILKAKLRRQGLVNLLTGKVNKVL